MTAHQKKFGWGDFIVGILFIIVGFISFRDPVGDLLSLTIVFGVVALVKGIYEIFFRRALRQYTGVGSMWLLIIGIIDVVIGVLFLFNLYQGMMILPYLFAVWIIADSIFNLMFLNFYKAFSMSLFWFELIISIISLIIGFMLFANPVVSALTLSFLVGFYLIWFGILKVVEAFTGYHSV